MKYVLPALRFNILMSVLLGLMYPFIMTGASQALFPTKANGQLLTRGGHVVGSLLIGQNFEKPEYFWPRPSAISYNPLPSGGSNAGQSSQDLKKLVDERRARLKAAHSDQAGEPPQDLLFASASGLDPHISVEAARYQLSRVAKTRKMALNEVEEILKDNLSHRQLEILGEETVNVLTLNLALDTRQGVETAH